MKPPVRFVSTSDGGRVAYQDFGAGALTTLFMVDWPATVDMVWEHPAHLRFWHYQSQLSRCIKFDPRGVGRSISGGTADVRSLHGWAEDAVAVLDAADAQQAIVFGEAYGTHAAVALAATYPERVVRLILANPFICLRASPERPYGFVDTAADMLIEQVRSGWGTGAIVMAFAPSLSSDEVFYDFCARFERAAGTAESAVQWAQAALHSDITPLLPKVRTPTLVMRTADHAYVHVEASRDVADAIAGAEFIESDSATLYWFDDEQTADCYSRFIFGEPQRAPGERLERAVMFTDIVRSTDHIAKHGDARWREVLYAIDAFVRQTVAGQRGRVVKDTGDGHLAEFENLGDAARAALAVRDGVHFFGVALRVGLHVGEVDVLPNGALGGFNIHIAARVMEAAGEDQILASEPVAAALEDGPAHLGRSGKRVLRGVPDPMTLYEVSRATVSDTAEPVDRPPTT